MRIFGGEQISGIMDRLNLPEDQPIENSLISKAIEQAQVKVEGFHFDIRKRLVEFDDVANQQREIVYKLRKRILESTDVKEEVLEKLTHQIEKIVLRSTSDIDSNIDYEQLAVGLADIIPFDDASLKRITSELKKVESKQESQELLERVLTDVYAKREKDLSEKTMREVER
ncbi:MAG: preprotein translocase subunit SecA, partial [Microgenomates group bacterium]